MGIFVVHESLTSGPSWAISIEPVDRVFPETSTEAESTSLGTFQLLRISCAISQWPEALGWTPSGATVKSASASRSPATERLTEAWISIVGQPSGRFETSQSA
jgi:hypothetical protein